MAKVQVKANWVEIDPSELSAEAQAGYRAYKEAYALAKAARERFEQGMQGEAKLPEGKRLAFGYNFGKLSMAVVDGEPVKAKAEKGLAALLGGQ